jgi:hypothetical protein
MKAAAGSGSVAAGKGVVVNTDKGTSASSCRTE